MFGVVCLGLLRQVESDQAIVDVSRLILSAVLTFSSLQYIDAREFDATHDHYERRAFRVSPKSAKHNTMYKRDDS